MTSVHRSPFRTYRATRHDDLVSFQLVIEETDLWVAAREDLGLPMADHVRVLRGQIKAYAAVHPEFLTSLEPIAAASHDPEIIRRIREAADAAPLPALPDGVVPEWRGDNRLALSYPPSRVQPDRIIDALRGGGLPIRDIAIEQPRLEDVFIELTRR